MAGIPSAAANIPTCDVFPPASVTKPFTKVASKIVPKETITESLQSKEEVNFEEEEELSVPDISGLDFDIQGSLKVSKSSVGDIMSVSDGNENPHIPTEIKDKGRKISKKKFIQLFTVSIIWFITRESV